MGQQFWKTTSWSQLWIAPIIKILAQTGSLHAHCHCCHGVPHSKMGSQILWLQKAELLTVVQTVVETVSGLPLNPTGAAWPLVPRTVFSRCGQSALAAVRVHVWSCNNHGCQGFRLQSCLVHSIQLGSKLFRPRKIKSHNTYKSNGKKSYGNIRMMPLNHGGRFDHGRHLLLDAARHGKTARRPQGVTMNMDEPRKISESRAWWGATLQ